MATSVAIPDTTNSYDEKATVLPKKRKSDSDITACVTLEMFLFVLREEGVEQVVGKRLSSSTSHSFGDEPQLVKPAETLKKMCSAMLKEYGPEMRQLCGTLDLSDGQIYSTYCAVADNCMSSDVSWGRIVSLMTFTGLLAAHLIKRGQECKVESLLGWERTFINSRCQSWIKENGGWKAIRLPSKESVGSTSAIKWLAPTVIGLGIAAISALIR